MRIARPLLIWFVILSGIAVPVRADTFEQRATLRIELDPPSGAKRGQTVKWRVIVDIFPGFHSYPTKQPDPAAADYVTTFEPPKSGEFVFVGDIKGPDGKPEMQEGMLVSWVTGEGDWEGQVVVHPKAQPGKPKLQNRGGLPVCNERNCLYGKFKPIEFEVSTETPQGVEERY